MSLDEVLRRFQHEQATWGEAMAALITAYPRKDPAYLERQLACLEAGSRFLRVSLAA